MLTCERLLTVDRAVEIPEIEQLTKGPGFYRLDQMGVEPGRSGALAVLILAVAGQCHDEHPATPRFLPQLPGDLIAIHARQANVQERDIGPKRLSHLERRRPVMGYLDLVSLHL